MKDLLVIHGVNLNLLGQREKNIYGPGTLEEIDRKILECCSGLNVAVEIFQTNHEGEIIDKIIQMAEEVKAVIINPGAFTHYSYAIRDCIAGVGIPAIEVHLTNIFAREPFRSHSVISPVCAGQISGFGPDSYILAVRAAMKFIERS